MFNPIDDQNNNADNKYDDSKHDMNPGNGGWFIGFDRDTAWRPHCNGPGGLRDTDNFL